MEAKIKEGVNLTAEVLRGGIAEAMSVALEQSNMTREDVAASMSALLGRKFSKYILDAYTSKSRHEHIPPIDVAIAFDTVTKQNALCKFFAKKLGGGFLASNELAIYALGVVTKEKELLAQKEKNIKIANGIIDKEFDNKISIDILGEECTVFQMILAWLIANCDSVKGVNFLRDLAFELEESKENKQKCEHSIATLDSIREQALSWQKEQ